MERAKNSFDRMSHFLKFEAFPAFNEEIRARLTDAEISKSIRANTIAIVALQVISTLAFALVLGLVIFGRIPAVCPNGTTYFAGPAFISFLSTFPALAIYDLNKEASSRLS